MTDFFDKLYTNINDNSKLLVRLKIYSAQRFLIRLLSNSLIPFYYRFNKKKYILESKENDNPKYIVSLTSFPKRINRVWIGIESILRQTHKPDRILLWLSKEQFKSLDELPKKLKEQQKRGLDIRLVEGNIKSHKKYFYALSEFQNDYLITVDDDIIYPTYLIDELVKLNKSNPNAICCHRAHEIKSENGSLLSYNFWDEVKGFSNNDSLFFTSGGGTIFPPHSLHVESLNSEVFLKYCFNADDIWLNAMSRLKGTNIVKSNCYSCLLPIYSFKNINLYEVNLVNGGNDKQLNDVRNYYIKQFGTDVFSSTFK